MRRLPASRPFEVFNATRTRKEALQSENGSVPSLPSLGSPESESPTTTWYLSCNTFTFLHWSGAFLGEATKDAYERLFRARSLIVSPSSSTIEVSITPSLAWSHFPCCSS